MKILQLGEVICKLRRNGVTLHSFLQYDTLVGKIIMRITKLLKIFFCFSSPNIAKPFHFGHMRSTMVGNFVANINSFARNEVIRMNYIGDWGLQFGMLKAGLEMCNFTEEEISKNPIKKLHEAYIKANLKKEEDPSIEDRAKNIFHELEFAPDDSAEIQQWRKFRHYTMDELRRIYERLGVTFDVYSWESDYSATRIKPLLDELKEKKIIVPEKDETQVRFDIRCHFIYNRIVENHGTYIITNKSYMVRAFT